METGALTADTWTKITKTIPGNSNLTFNNDNGVGLQIDWWAFAGTNYTDSGVTLNQWATYSSGTRLPDNTSTWWTTNDATFEITGVQLEVGSVATDFEHRSFGDELKRCQRYYHVAVEGTNRPIGSGTMYTASGVYVPIFFPVTMRTDPSLEHTTGTNYYNIAQNATSDFFNQFDNIWRNSVNMSYIHAGTGVSGTQGQAAMVQTQNASAKIAFSAEL